MDLLPFGELPAYAPRRFVPTTIDLGDWAQVNALFDRLDQQAAACARAPDLERWLIDWGELSAAVDEESSRRYIAMTCHTDDRAAEEAFLHFVEQIEPKLKPRQFRLSEIYLKHPWRRQLPSKRFEVFDRDTEVHVQLYRPENVPLETEEAKLGQQYQKLTGSLTVRFRGEERTLPQMARCLEETDRAVRQEAWELTVRRRLEEAENFDAIFDELVRLRERIAANAGFKNYLEYAFRAKRRFDYTPADCRAFHDAIAAEVVPALRQLQDRRRAQLGLTKLRPWDLNVDPLNQPPLRPFEAVADLLEKTQRIFDHLDPELAGGFRLMRDLRLLDLANRKAKAPGGYQSTLNEARLPFVFMNAVGVQRDVDTLLHESGHAFHALASRPEELYAYRAGTPIEFCEVASMSMELLGRPHLETFYPTADADRARREQLEDIVKFFPWMAAVDAFQHWVYTHPGHSRQQRAAAWEALLARFGDNVDWTGYEPVRASLWHRQLHIFLHPFYYVEYGIAQLGALQVWRNSRQDHPRALAAYKKALALGGSRPLPELFAAAGCQFAFDTQTIRPLMALVQDELQRTEPRSGTGAKD